MNKPFLPRALLTILFVVGSLSVTQMVYADQQHDMLLLTMPAILAAKDSTPEPPEPPPTTDPLTLRVYVAGESVEEFNHINTKPFSSNGLLNGASNTTAEYGWMVPLAERLMIRDPNLSVKWVGSGYWTNQDTWECSTASYTNPTIGHTSAQAGSTIQQWQTDRGSELTAKEYCYDIAFAARGGNDIANGVSKALYESQLRQLVLDLEQGSNCRTHPIIYVTAHLLDTGGWSYGYSQQDIDNWMAEQKAYYVDIAKRVASELDTGGRHIRFIDMWTPFRDDAATTAFPAETWWMLNGNGVSMPDLDKIHRDAEQHPRRLASIFAGENVADQINITEVRTLLGK